MIPEGLFPVVLTPPVTTSGGVTTDYINIGKAQMAYVVVTLKQTVGHATVFALERATAAASGNVVIANTVPIWYGNVTTATNALAKQTDAISYTMGGSVTGTVQIIFRVDPATLGTTYKFLGMTVSDSSQATNFVSAVVYLLPRWAPPTANQIEYVS